MVEDGVVSGLGARMLSGSYYGQTIQIWSALFMAAICAAAARLSERRHGALIVLERGDPLDEFIATGVPLNSDISPQLLLTVF